MAYILSAMGLAGFLSASVLHWRFLTALGLLMLVATMAVAILRLDPWILGRGFSAFAVAQLGYVAGGLALEAWRPGRRIPPFEGTKSTRSTDRRRFSRFVD